MWLEGYNLQFRINMISPNGEFNKQIFSNPHPWSSGCYGKQITFFIRWKLMTNFGKLTNFGELIKFGKLNIYKNWYFNLDVMQFSCLIQTLVH